MGPLDRALGTLVPARWGYEAAVQVENFTREYEIPMPPVPAAPGVPPVEEEPPRLFAPFFPEQDLKEANKDDDYRWMLFNRALICLGLFVWLPGLAAYLRLKGRS
jgi:hypothetical protein